MRVIEDFADARVRVQKLSLNVRRVDRFNQKLRLQKGSWWELSAFENLMNRKSTLPWVCDRESLLLFVKVSIFLVA